MHETLRALGGVPRLLFGTGMSGRTGHLFGFGREGASTRRACARGARGEAG